MKLIVLLSGGLDSTTLLYEMERDHEVVAALSFDYGAKHNHRELPMAAYHCNKLGISHLTIPMAFINDYFSSDLLKSGGAIPEGHYAAENMKSTVVPARNAIMLSIAAGFAESHGAEGVAYGPHTGDHFIYRDCREEFLKPMAEALREGTDAAIQLLRPFVKMNKGEIVQRGIELGMDYSKTWSCYKGEEVHCGRCGTCVERREAFSLAGVEDPTVYQNS
ncbi:MAG: 7-cyano-7-deazaguanine synthase QueC [Chthoniobacterales bacterium]|nr:7-cyano-7-deazaguanine synthase QueC [Chthoniobacterales bacterium]